MITYMSSANERFALRVSILPNGCHEWTGYKSNGYGVFNLSSRPRKVIYAHRFAWEMANGPMPEHLETDHTCRNRACVNVAHMEAVTHAENMRRIQRASTCVNGHSRPPGERCVLCNRAHVAKWVERNRDEHNRRNREAYRLKHPASRPPA